MVLKAPHKAESWLTYKKSFGIPIACVVSVEIAVD
jgi:hypothetical protein